MNCDNTSRKIYQFRFSPETICHVENPAIIQIAEISTGQMVNEAGKLFNSMSNGAFAKKITLNLEHAGNRQIYLSGRQTLELFAAGKLHTLNFRP
jgi:hypothetical protein